MSAEGACRQEDTWEPPTEVPGREDSSELSQGRRARGGHRVLRGQEPHTWHLVDVGESKEKFREAGVTLGFLAGMPGKLAHVLS